MPSYSEERILKAIEGCRGYVTVVARRLGCKRDTVAERLKKSERLRAAMDAELDKKGDEAEMLLEQMMSEKVPVVVKRLKVVRGGKTRVVEEERMVFSKAATPALIFFLKTKLKARGYAEGRDGAPADQTGVEEQLRRIADGVFDLEPRKK